MFNAFRQALGKIAEIQPDLIIIAGDLFHTVRPSNLVIQHTFGALLNLREKTSAPIVIIGGNHDSPKSVDTGCILDLLTNIPGIYVAHGEYQGIRIEDIDTTVFCLCHRALEQLNDLKLEPHSDSRHNILALHGCVEGVARDFAELHSVRPSDILNDAWDYVACGHFHMYTRLADNAYYSGSVEFTSFNIWEEANEPKGFIEYDTDNRNAVFHPLQTRDVIDLRLIDAHDLDASQLNDMIIRRIEGIEGGHTDKIIRLVIENLRREVQVDLDYAFVRQIKAEALHFEVQCRQPKREWNRTEAGSEQSRPLEVEWRDFVSNGADIPGGVELDQLLELGMTYLGRQEALAD